MKSGSGQRQRLDRQNIGDKTVEKGATAAAMSSPTQQAQTPGSRKAPEVTKPAGPHCDPVQDTQGPRALQGPRIRKKPRRGAKPTRRQQGPHFKPTATPARGPAHAKAPLQTSKGRHRNGPRQKRERESKGTEGPKAGPHITSTAKQVAQRPNTGEAQSPNEAKPKGTGAEMRPKESQGAQKRAQ